MNYVSDDQKADWIFRLKLMRAQASDLLALCDEIEAALAGEPDGLIADPASAPEPAVQDPPQGVF